MASMYEIAREAGVSASTAARALRGTGYCSPESKEKVLAAAKRLGYIPSHAARSLKLKRTQKILFCIPDIYNPFYFRMIKGVTDVLEKYDYFPILCHTRGKAELELKILRNLQEGYGDGMVFVSFDFNERNIQAVNACGCPVVLTNHYQSPAGEDKFDCVYVDTYEGIRRACLHLIDSGYRRIGYIGGGLNQTGRERLAGFTRAMHERGLTPHQSHCKVGDFSMESGRRNMLELLDDSRPPEALVAANDLMAIGALQVCKERHMNIPDDMAIIGMDNSDLAAILGLSSIRMQEEEIGRQAATMLMERILRKRQDKRTIRLLPELVLRASTGINVKNVTLLHPSLNRCANCR